MTGEGRRRLALQRMRWETQRMAPGEKVWRYRNTFAQGYLITRGPTPMKPREDWHTLQFGPWVVQCDSLLERQMTAEGNLGVLVLGQAFDDAGARGRDRIAAKLLRVLTGAVGHDDAVSAIALARSREALEEVISWLSGRYLVLISRGDTLDVYGDPIATRICYWHIGNGRVALASHSALLADLAGGLDVSRMRWVLRHPDYKSPAGKWLPGLITPHDGVGQLYANCRLEISATNEVTHRRFFPRADRVEQSEAEVFEVFREELRRQVRNWISVAPLTVLGLTAGGDSRAILEAGLVDLQRADAMAVTYHPFHMATKSTYEDYSAANRLAAAAGMRHLVLDVKPMSPDSQMASLYGTTFPTWQRYSALVSTMYGALPARAVTLFGVGGAIITGMIIDRSVKKLSAGLLARKYAHSKFADDPELHTEFERWMDFTEFTPARLRGYDFYDYFHWEHRMSKWGAVGYSEYDLATIPGPVLSSRRLLLAALSLPWEVRQAGDLYRSIRYENALAD